MTNRFEEVNFKLDKLSNRVSKIQSDAQLRFSDLESYDSNLNINNKVTKKKLENLPGTDMPQDFGSAPGYNLNSKLFYNHRFKKRGRSIFLQQNLIT